MDEFEKALEKAALKNEIYDDCEIAEFIDGARWARDWLNDKTHFNRAIQNGQRAKELQAENARLIEALEALIEACEDRGGMSVEHARAALQNEGDHD